MVSISRILVKGMVRNGLLLKKNSFILKDLGLQCRLYIDRSPTIRYKVAKMIASINFRSIDFCNVPFDFN